MGSGGYTFAVTTGKQHVARDGNEIFLVEFSLKVHFFGKSLISPHFRKNKEEKKRLAKIRKRKIVGATLL